MPAPGGPDELDLTGAWSGLYHLPASREPVFFDAMLAEAESWLTGSTTETVTLAGRRHVLGASLQGRRAGRLITWLKIYDGAVPGYDTVHYEGGINEDATEIEGKWSIPGNWSGKFLMIRSGGRQAARSRAALQDA